MCEHVTIKKSLIISINLYIITHYIRKMLVTRKKEKDLRDNIHSKIRGQYTLKDQGTTYTQTME